MDPRIIGGDELDAVEFPSRSVPIRQLLESGACSPECLLALAPEGPCSCRCGGDFHGLAVDLSIDVHTDIPPEAIALRCWACGGRMQGEGIIAADRLWHPGCFSPTASGSGDVHREAYPECPERWHDMWDHPSLRTTTAVVATMRNRALTMPDQCPGDCRTDGGIPELYYPFMWSDGQASYECVHGHRWTCVWPMAATGQGFTPTLRGVGVSAIPA